MDANTAAVVIQRWFRSKFTKKECIISQSNFLSLYEVVIDKQTYNANQMLLSLKHSSFVPHSRREITDMEFEYIHEKYNPFDTTFRSSYQHDSTNEVNGCSPRPPMSFILNKASIMCVQ